MSARPLKSGQTAISKILSTICILIRPIRDRSVCYPIPPYYSCHLGFEQPSSVSSLGARKNTVSVIGSKIIGDGWYMYPVPHCLW